MNKLPIATTAVTMAADAPRGDANTDRRNGPAAGISEAWGSAWRSAVGDDVKKSAGELLGLHALVDCVDADLTIDLPSEATLSARIKWPCDARAAPRRREREAKCLI